MEELFKDIESCTLSIDSEIFSSIVTNLDLHKATKFDGSVRWGIFYSVTKKAWNAKILYEDNA